ncbi:hypothetical protein DFH11DRAFT_1696526 [Phellopilus nigrolimitatus]|nr:hypothetical protein DFH11DRAFT_1696526 [Phellopilus nigrolimitatus]
MQNPAAGSANPAASFPALWNYLRPALDHIVRAPTNTPERAPAIDVAYHMGIHTAVYNYFTASRFDVNAFAPADAPAATPPSPGGAAAAAARASSPPAAAAAPHGADLYDTLDRYYAALCRELLASAPPDDASLLHYLLPCFRRYAAGAGAVSRLLNYVNRHYVKRAVEEDRGWLRLADILDAVVAQAVADGEPTTTTSTAASAATAATTTTGTDTVRPREQLAARLRERRAAELKRWGCAAGAPPDALARAEAAAEAASPPDRIVPLASLALRRFRADVVRPLLAVPRGKKGRKKHKRLAPPPPANSGPKSRLARAAKELIESKSAGAGAAEEEERYAMAAELSAMLGAVGIPVDHLLRKKLDKFVALRPQG